MVSNYVDSGLTKDDQEGLVQLCSSLLSGADLCPQSPHYIVQPFFGIIKDHSELIGKLNLMAENLQQH